MKKDPLTRTQVLLEPVQLEQLSRIAVQEGKSLSALLREWINLVLSQRQDQALAHAAEKLMSSYYSDGDLVGYGTLDGDEFSDRSGG
jgi:hypothetical protein